VAAAQAAEWKDKVDVLILCGGSATDLPKQTPEFAKLFNVVDSFDTHANIPTHYAEVDAAAKAAGNVGVSSVGWDPGMFSLARVYANAVLTNGADYTFWGRGVSQGHSDAIRRIPGVRDAKQYTVPVPAALEAVRSGSNPPPPPRFGRGCVFRPVRPWRRIDAATARTPTSTPERARAWRMRGAPYVPPETSCSQATASSKRRRADARRPRWVARLFHA